MTTFQVGKDYETSEQAGAGGMFQIDTLIDENENDVTDKIDVGRHFNNDEDLKKYLSGIFKIPKKEIDIDEI
jgi:type I restriction enzyme S subunit